MPQLPSTGQLSVVRRRSQSHVKTQNSQKWQTERIAPVSLTQMTWLLSLVVHTTDGRCVQKDVSCVCTVHKQTAATLHVYILQTSPSRASQAR